MEDNTGKWEVKIGHYFPLRELSPDESNSDERTRYTIVLCIILAFSAAGAGGIVSSLLSGDHTLFQVIWSTIHTFVGILIGYYFGRHGQRGGDDKEGST